MTRRLANMVAFARFCQCYEIDPVVAAALIQAAARAFRLGEYNCNKPGFESRLKAAQLHVEELAIAVGFTVSWPGLAPCLERAGQTVNLPD